MSADNFLNKDDNELLLVLAQESITSNRAQEIEADRERAKFVLESRYSKRIVCATWVMAIATILSVFITVANLAITLLRR